MIYPAILESTLEETLAKAKLFEGVSELVHIDIGDGDFVSHNSMFRPEDLVAQLSLNYQIHLMVRSPFFWIENKIAQIRTVIFQAEVVDNYLETAAFFKNLGYKVGLSINPATPVPEFFDNIDFVQFMTVEPGAQGKTFEQPVLEKIVDFKFKVPSVKVQADGGINLENLPLLRDKGVTNFVVGSGIYNSPDPVLKYQEFLNV
jgi:ribulose-phosphate 3-epimerase